MINEKTLAVWKTFEQDPRLAGFVLVGGTALSLRIQHRDSEDLDFAFTSPLLPKRRVELFAQHHGLSPADRIEDIEDFLDSGLDLFDHQRNFLTPDGVKVSFFAPETGIGKLLSAYAGHPKPVVASVEDIFRMKAIVCASRSKSRDWLDVYVLMREHGFSMGDFEKAFEDFGNPLAIDIALARMRSGKADLHDEGFAALRSGAPTVGEMAEFFRQASDAYAREKMKGRPSSPRRPLQ